MIEPAILLSTTAVLGWCAWTDLNSARIDNRASVLLLLIGVAATYSAGIPFAHIAAFAVTLLSTWFMWQNDMLGGGDVKMLSVLALIMGTAFPWFLVAFGFCAALIAVSRPIMPNIWRTGARSRLVPLGLASFPAFLIVTFLEAGV